MKDFLLIVRSTVLVVAPIGFFFQRSLPFDYLLSVDNTTWFIAYWLFIPMAIWFAVEKFYLEEIQKKREQEEGYVSMGFFRVPRSLATAKQIKDDDERKVREHKQKKQQKKQGREQAVLREREFIKEAVRKHKKKNKNQIDSVRQPKSSKTKVEIQETTEDKLKKLKDLYDQDLISKEVYDQKQLEALSE